jgi:hypothetical protein
MNDALRELTAAQHGLLARYQALEKGMSAGQWGWIARSDDWERVHPGVYRRVGARRTWQQAQMAGCLAAGGLSSHQAAGTLWGLPDVEQGLEITIVHTRRVTLKGFVVHHTRHLQSVDRSQRAGIPVTSLARTVIDLSLESPELAPKLIDHVLAGRKVALALLVNSLEGLGTRGRRGAGDLRGLLEERRGRARHVDSGLQRRFERIALDGYRAGLLPKPLFECPVQLTGGRWRYPDVGYPTVFVGFEALSYEHHSTLPAFAADAERTIDLFGEGWVIVPVTEIQVREPDRLVARMARIIAAVGARRVRG